MPISRLSISYKTIGIGLPYDGTYAIFEHRTDNVMDNGPRFSSPDGSDIIQNYMWKGNTDATGIIPVDYGTIATVP